MGELHLEIIRDRLLREFKVGANAGAPQIAYRETITQAAEGEGKFIRQSGGRGQIWSCKGAHKASGTREGNIGGEPDCGGVIPKEFVPHVIAGIRRPLPEVCWPTIPW